MKITLAEYESLEMYNMSYLHQLNSIEIHCVSSAYLGVFERIGAALFFCNRCAILRQV